MKRSLYRTRDLGENQLGGLLMQFAALPGPPALPIMPLLVLTGDPTGVVGSPAAAAAAAVPPVIPPVKPMLGIRCVRDVWLLLASGPRLLLLRPAMLREDCCWWCWLLLLGVLLLLGRLNIADGQGSLGRCCCRCGLAKKFCAGSCCC